MKGSDHPAAAGGATAAATTTTTGTTILHDDGLAQPLADLRKLVEDNAVCTTPRLSGEGRVVHVRIPLLIREVAQLCLDMDTSLRVPTFSFLWAMPALESLGVSSRGSTMTLRPFSEVVSPIPTFASEKPKPGVMAPLLLKRSVSLLERESSWKVAYDGCHHLKERIVQAQHALRLDGTELYCET